MPTGSNGPKRGWRWYRVALTAWLAGVVLAAGCNNWSFLRHGGQGGPARGPVATPPPADLVAAVNDNARRLQSLQAADVRLDAAMKGQPLGLTGRMMCQQPRSFRLLAVLAGSDMADLGSNDNEFWFWIAKNEPPYLYHCSHQDFAQGRVRQFPFQPDWVMQALGMAELDPRHAYQVEVQKNTFDLVEQIVLPQGQTVRKVVMFNKAPPPYQVVGHRLQEMDRRDICVATIRQAQRDHGSGAVYPSWVQLSWPADQVELKMMLHEVTINRPADAAQAARLFARPYLPNVQGYNLALGPDAPMQRVGGVR